MTKLFLEETKDEMKKNNTRSNQKGVSTITLVITIVVMLILLALAFGYSGLSINEASRAEFFQEVSLVQQQSSEKRLANQIYGTGEVIENKGFYKTKIKNPPEDFVSFSEDAIYGYVVDLEYIKFDSEAKRGLDYKRFSTDTESNIVEFGVDDVYVYDKGGKVFYVGGYLADDGIYYTSDTVEKAGPEIVLVDKTVSDDNKSVKLTIVVRKIEGGTLTVEVDGKDATRISEEGTEETYEITVYENKTHKIKATEVGQGTTTSSVEVTEIDAEVYTVTYNANGGADAPGAQTKTENVIMRITEQVPVKAGYVFLGWNENASETVATYKPGSEFTLNKNTVLYAIWSTDEERTFSVTYNANGGDGAPQAEENLAGEYTISSEVPTRAGYGFEGWSIDPKAATATYHAGDVIMVSENLVLYAVWVRGTKTVLVTVEPEGAGTVTGNGARLAGGEVYISTTPAQGYTFKNWTIKSGGINLANSTSTSTTFIMPDSDVELVANYEINGLTVKYNSNKGSVISKTEVVQYGEEIVVTTLEPIRQGYDFIGWALSQDAKEPEYHAGDLYPVFQNTVFYAVWLEHVETYTITYDLNGGTGNKAGGVGIFVPQTKSQGGTIQIPVGGEEEPYRLDFTFKGWSLAENSYDVVLKPGDTYYKDEDLKLYAVWKDEVAPRITITAQKDEATGEIKIVGKSHDEGIIAGYAWTMTETEPVVWETEKAGTKDVEEEKIIDQKGRYYFWVKDWAGNVNVESTVIYEIKFDPNGGVGAPDSQLQPENIELTLPSDILTRDRYLFLGWSTAVNPGNTENDVEYLSGGKIKINSDTTLRAVWGEAFFELSSNSGISQIDGENIIITVRKSLYTGNIRITSDDSEIATGSESNGIITIVPGTKVGETIIHVEEDRTGFKETITVVINKGIRQLNLNETSKIFLYGDPSAQIGFTHRGKDAPTTVTSNDTSIATASLNGKTIIIIPKNFGTAIITLRISEDDQYLEKTGEIAVTVAKREIIVTPTSNQKKVYDGTAVTPRLTYSWTGNLAGEVPDFTGILEREIGVDVGKYEINKGTLELIDNNSFLASNYTLSLSPVKVYFEITPKPITPPAAITPQEYDGTTKYGIESSPEYIRGGEYAQTNAGRYTAVATLTDLKNYMWSDTKNTTAKNIAWEITSYNLTGGKITVNPVSSMTYTGNEIKPIPTVVYDNKITLVSGTDYTLSYSDNVNVGTGTITITGKGNYSGTITTTFQITKATMQVEASDYTGTFDNQDHTITVKPTWPSSGATIYYSTTELTSSNHTSGQRSPIYYKDAGTHTIYYYVVNSNFFDHSGSRKVTINPKPIGTSITVTGVTNKEYTGSDITQTVTVKENEQNRNLVEGTDYELSYSNNVNVGTYTASVIIEGRGNFNGTKAVNFSILGDTITMSKSTDSLASSLTVSISKKIPVTTLQYKIDNGSWTNYTGEITITKDCTVYGRTVHNGNTIGTNSITITNICEHQYSAVTCVSDSRCVYCNLLKEEKLGHDYTSQTPTSTYLKTAATCTTKAVYYYKCIRCTEKGTDTYEHGAPLNHSYTSQTPTSTYLKTAATCTTKAVYYHKCIRCTEKGTTTYEHGEQLGHQFDIQLVTDAYKRSDADCETPATYYFKCIRCAEKGTTYYSNGNALGHEYNTELPTPTYLKSEATCTVSAVYYYKCDRCNAKGTNTYSHGAPQGHNFTTQSQTPTYLKSAATCTENATYYYKCSRCDAKDTSSYTAVGSVLGHDWGEYSITTNPTCTKTGIQTRYCLRCGESETAVVSELGHNYTASSSSVRSEATCTVAQTNWHKCSRCTSISSTKYYSTGKALGHDYKAATCTVAATCKRCSVTTGEPLGHSYSDPTCTVGSTCTRCGIDGEGALGHTYGGYTTTKPETCTTDGTKVRYCIRCNKEESAVIPATDHSYGGWVTTKYGTCINKGSKKRTCSKCGDVQTQQVALNPDNHEGGTTMVVTREASCTLGSITKEQCLGCNKYTGVEETGAALGHNYSTATCIKLATCSRCSGTTGSYADHKYSTATCTKLATCSVCNKTTGSLAAHTYGSYTTTKAATCTATGTKVRYCEKCNAADSAVIAKLDHNYNEKSVTPTYLKSEATCTSAAVYYYKCTGCTAKGTITYTSGGSKGHDYTSKTTTTTYLKTAAKCTSAAVYYYKCSRCTAKGTDTYTSGGSLGHNGSTEGNLITAATCTSAALYSNICTRCGANLGTVSVGSAKGHSYSTATCIKLATCSCGATTGSYADHKYSTATCTKLATCSVCKATTGSYAAHSYGEYTVTKAATCTATGTKTRKCNNCTDTQTVTIDKLSHTYSAQSQTPTYLRSSATCTEDATYYYKCSGCTAKGTSWYTVLSKYGHNYASQTQTPTYLKSPATCTADATYYYKCSRCTSKGTKSYTASGTATGHSYTATSTSVRSQATCTEPQTNWRKCANCTSISSTEYYSTGSAKGHSYSTATCIKVATCSCGATTGGYGDHQYSTATCTKLATCSVCKGTTGSLAAHSYGEYTTTKAATCTAKGTKTRKCNNCSATDTAEIPMIAHNYASKTMTTTYLRKAASCTVDATYYYKCTNCSAKGSTYYTATGTAPGHSYTAASSSVRSSASCTRAQTNWYKCANCSSISSTDYYSTGSANGHSYTATSSSVRSQATCTELQTNWYKCAKCSLISTTDYYSTGSLKAHSYTLASSVVRSEANCTTAQTNWRKCSGCTSISSTQYYTVGNSLGHDYTATSTSVRSQATCTAAQTNWRKCSRCTSISSTYYYTVGNPTAHSYSTATCTKKATCSCGATTGDYAAHSYGAYTVTKAATCTAAGSQTRTCSVCSATDTASIAARAHNWSSSWTSGANGHWKKCTRQNPSCSTTSVVQAHSWVSAGAMSKICTVCYYYISPA